MEENNIVIENREKMTISGVTDVFSFDDQIIILETNLGLLTIKGENLKINKLNIDTLDFSLNGKISSVSYSDGVFSGKQNNFFGKIFLFPRIFAKLDFEDYQEFLF